MERYVCIHGHFYQPPRENPWLEAIELQDSAYPFHDWNERICAESYEPNAHARILDGENRIVDISNNYARISFNFGPTLLAWMQVHEPDVYRAVLDADRESRQRFSGHGSAIAQVYNHVIMPLANRRDKITQVRWGIADFRHRFGRKPEGMWLAETAVDLETLEVLVDHGIRFTILSPYQAGRVRRRGGRKWLDARGAKIDPTTPYVQRLPSGRTIVIFFYDGPISQAIAFEQLLVRGEHLAHRLVGAFADDRGWPQLVHIATDGETYGHHHKHGEMALAYALKYIEKMNEVKVTNYGEYLAKHRQFPFVEIVENTAWSCSHGVERWRSNCGCNSGRPGWHQEWRGPLRDALDWLRDELAPLYEQAMRPFVEDPWAVRDEYIQVVLDRTPENVTSFLTRYAVKTLTAEEEIKLLKLLEMQRYAMLMYTSCGWFFDELSGIETVQVIQYAGRAVQLAQEVLEADPIEHRFLERLAAAKSNLPEHGDGRRIYETHVRPAIVDLSKVAGHYAASSVFDQYARDENIYCYHVQRKDYQSLSAGRTRLVLGHCRITSQITRQSSSMQYACVHLGDHNLMGGVVPYSDKAQYQAMVEDLQTAFRSADIPETLHRLHVRFGDSRYSLKTLFRDQQRRILDQILQSTLDSVEATYRQLFEQFAPLMRFLDELGSPIPPALRNAAQTIVNADLRRALRSAVADPERVRGLLEQALIWQARLDEAGLRYSLQRSINQHVAAVDLNPADLQAVDQLQQWVDVTQLMPFEVDLSKAQNVYYALLRRVTRSQTAPSQDQQQWLDRLKTLGAKMAIRVQV